jgi:hypothetical protein
MINDLLFLMASQSIHTISRLPRDAADFEFSRLGLVLANQENRRFEERLAPSSREEAHLLLSYIDFVGDDEARSNLLELSIDVHSWFLERLEFCPAVMSPEWRGRNSDLIERGGNERLGRSYSDHFFVRLFVNLYSPLCRHLLVSALLAFDVYNREFEISDRTAKTSVSQLWDWINIENGSKPASEDIERHLPLLLEIADILLDESQIRSEALDALTAFLGWVKNGNLSSKMVRSVVGFVSDRASLFGGDLGQSINKFLHNQAEWCKDSSEVDD